MSEPIASRHDILILFEVTNGNPNGDPDAGNQPRIDAASGRGLVSDVCLKRKVRNYVDLFAPPSNGKAFQILIKQGNVLNAKQAEAERETKDGVVEKKDKARIKDQHGQLIKDWLCNQYYDIRTFGQVISTGSEVMKGSPHGQIRGPVQFSFGRSFDPIAPQEITITRCVATKVDSDSDRTMGQKYIIPYGLYAAKCYLSPKFAENTGFDRADYDLFIEAVSHLFDHDRSAARGDMVVRGVLDFEHVGTQSESNPAQNRREAMLGCAHAHELFETVKVALKSPGSLPQGFGDYDVAIDFDEGRFPGVKLHRHVDPVSTR